MTYSLTAVRATDVLARVASIVAPLALTHKVHVRVDMPGHDIEVHADSGKLTQVMINLVTNAIKFTPTEGKVIVRARRSGSQVEFSVRDEGPGIPADKLASIFDPYVQVDHRGTSQRPGSGLGLAISREFTEGMGGSLVVDSSPGKGSTFTCSIRAHRPDRPAWRSRVSPVSANLSIQARSGLPAS